MTGQACNAELPGDAIVARARAWIGTPYRAPGELPRRRDRLPRAAARALARDARGRSPRRCRPIRPTGRSRRGRRTCWRRRGGIWSPVAAAEARPGDVLVLRMRDGGVAKHVGILARSPRGACDADPCLFRAWRGRIAADAGLGAADRGRLPLSRQEDLMATLLSVCGRRGARRRGRRLVRGPRARWCSARRSGATARLGDRPAAARGRVGAGRDRAGRAVPGHGIERGRGAGAGLRAGAGGRADDLVEPVPGVGQHRGRRRQGRRRRHGPRVQLLGEPRRRALRGRGVADRADLGGRAGGRPVGADLAAASRDRGPAARSADRGDRGRGAGLSRHRLCGVREPGPRRRTATGFRSSTSRCSGGRRPAAGRAAAAGARRPRRGAGAGDRRVCAGDRAGALQARQGR